MEDRAKRLFKVYDNVPGLGSDISIKANEVQLKKALSSIYSPGPSFYVIFDFPSKSFIHISEKVNSILGITPDQFSLKKLLSIIHPDDFEQVVKNEAALSNFFQEFLNLNEKLFYKSTYQFRVLDSLKGYKLILLQEIMLTLDEEGKISNTLVNFSDISAYGDKGNRAVSFIDIRGIKSYASVEIKKDIEIQPLEKGSLSPREIEILHLISEGYNSKEIADMLFISFDTVRTHRNNIISRNNFKSINHAIAHYIRNGLM